MMENPGASGGDEQDAYVELEENHSIPCQCQSDTMLGDFKRVVKNIADDINDLSKLTFMCDVDRSNAKGDKLTALDVLRKQVQKGTFAQDNVAPLERLLKDIDRCDLVSKHIEPYKQTYGEHAVSRGKWRYLLFSLTDSVASQTNTNNNNIFVDIFQKYYFNNKD